jgi:hypothetical protein
MIYFEIIDYRHGKTIILTKIMESNRLQSDFFEKKQFFIIRSHHGFTSNFATGQLVDFLALL